MNDGDTLPEHPNVLVTDFDGTLGRPDYYQLVLRRLVPPGTPNYWDEYRSGRITHFDALRNYFLAAEGGEQAFRALTDEIRLPDNLPQLIDRLHQNDWGVVVVSAGCRWYIDILLERSGVRLPVIANPGYIEAGRLHMDRPAEGPFYSFDVGVNKAAVVRELQQAGQRVSFAGDGFPDYEASRLAAEDLRFARSDLAQVCRDQGIGYRPFDKWDEVVDALLTETPL